MSRIWSALAVIPAQRKSSAEIAYLFAVANREKNASESERQEAVQVLLREFRSQLDQFADALVLAAQQEPMNEFPLFRAATPKDAKPPTIEPSIAISPHSRTPAFGERPEIGPLLLQGIKDWGFRIFSKPDPISALKQLLKGTPKPGKRAKNDDRDFEIAVDVAEKTLSGLTVEDAAAAVAEERHKPGAERIQAIYKQHRADAQADVKLRALDRS